MPKRLGGVILLSIALGCAMAWPAASPAQSVAAGTNDKTPAPTQFCFLILRPRVKVYKERLLAESKIEEGASDDVQAGLHGVVSRAFEDNGYLPRFDTSQIAQWEEAAENRAAVKALQDDYDAAYCPVTGTDPNCRRPAKLSLQGELSAIPESGEFDAVVIARASGVELTKPERLNPYSSGDHFHLYFSIEIVDVKSGLTLFACEGGATGDYISAPDARLARPVETCLKPYVAKRAKLH